VISARLIVVSAAGMSRNTVQRAAGGSLVVECKGIVEATRDRSDGVLHCVGSQYLQADKRKNDPKREPHAVARKGFSKHRDHCGDTLSQIKPCPD
jgi:hypothetical protein